MKAKKLRRIVEDVLAQRDILSHPEGVTFKTIEVSFVDRTITVGGRTSQITTDAVSIPILGGDVVLIPQRGFFEQIA